MHGLDRQSVGDLVEEGGWSWPNIWMFASMTFAIAAPLQY